MEEPFAQHAWQAIACLRHDALKNTVCVRPRLRFRTARFCHAPDDSAQSDWTWSCPQARAGLSARARTNSR